MPDYRLSGGILFGILRTVPNKFLSSLGTIYVEIFRNVPLIVQFFTVSGDPEFLPSSLRDWFKMDLDPNIQFFISSTLCLGLFTAARMTEQVRAAIQSLPRGQKAAGLAMGLTLPQTYRYVLLPNAYRVIIPPMTSEMLNLVKNSAIASTIGLVDMAAQAGKLLDYSARAYESFTAITLAYVGINVIIMLAMHLLEKRVRLRDRRPLMYEFDWSSVMRVCRSCYRGWLLRRKSQLQRLLSASCGARYWL